MKTVLILMVMTFSSANISSQAPKRSEIVSLNGTNIYYEVYGSGEPMFLLHGFTESSKSWNPFISKYASDFEVYLVDLKGHGKSSQFTENLSIKAVAGDIDALIKYLNLDSINAIGFSYGGDILFHLSLIRPGIIKSMITIGACGSWNANDFPSWIEYLSYKNIENMPWMREQQTSEEQIKSILNQVPNYIISISVEELKSIKAKTLIVLGDHDDSISLECVASAKNNIPDSYLWILPNTGHSAHKNQNQDDFVRISKEFFSNSWSK